MKRVQHGDSFNNYKRPAARFDRIKTIMKKEKLRATPRIGLNTCEKAGTQRERDTSSGRALFLIEV